AGRAVQCRQSPHLFAGARMQGGHLFQHRGFRWGLYLAFWTSLGLFNICQGYLRRSAAGRPVAWPEALVSGLADWYVWAALTPGILWLARRFPFEGAGWRRSLAVHAAGSLAAALAVCAVLSLALHHAGYEGYRATPVGELFRTLALGPFLVFYVWIYLAIVLVSQAWAYARKYRERELQTSQLAAQLARAELQALKMEIHPHFLFNTLHTISALMHKDVEVADDMLSQLADLLRATLDRAPAQEVPLRQELEFITSYLQIEQARL